MEHQIEAVELIFVEVVLVLVSLVYGWIDIKFKLHGKSANRRKGN